ncbi:PASTA domain-containing protein [Streptomyces phytophilus]|uniref:PASTA domain-containing protein n=1 Tax=Streptomyces phytophilus TaxID=722715 RepID=UPI0035A8C57B
MDGKPWYQDAEQTLLDAGLDPSIQCTLPAGKVIVDTTSPSPGTLVEEGSESLSTVPTTSSRRTVLGDSKAGAGTSSTPGEGSCCSSASPITAGSRLRWRRSAPR